MASVLFIVSFVTFSLFFFLKEKDGKIKKARYFWLLVSIIITFFAIFTFIKDGRILSANLGSKTIQITFPTDFKESINDGIKFFESKTKYGFYKALISEKGDENNFEKTITLVKSEYENVNWGTGGKNKLIFDYETNINGTPMHVYNTIFDVDGYIITLYVFYRVGNRRVEDSFDKFMNPVIADM